MGEKNWLIHCIGNRHIKIINLVHFFSIDRNYSRIIFVIIRKYSELYPHMTEVTCFQTL